MGTTAQGLAGIRALAGKDLGTTGWRRITQERVNTFADATGDHQWIHVDAERAAQGPFRSTIAHGYLTLSLIVPMFDELVSIAGVSMGINYGLDKVRFPSPVPVGSSIRLGGQVAEVNDVAGNGVETLIDFVVAIEDVAKPACVARAVYRYYA